MLRFAGPLGALSLGLGILFTPPAEASESGNYWARLRPNDAPVAGRFTMYAYMLDSLDTALPAPGPGRFVVLYFLQSNGKNSFVVPGDLVFTDKYQQSWKQGVHPVGEERLAGFLDKKDRRWALWWVPLESESLIWELPGDLSLEYGFSRTHFTKMKDEEVAKVLKLIPWDDLAAVGVEPDRPNGRPQFAINAAAFDTPPEVFERRAPVYPKSSRIYSLEGTVHVAALIDEEGAVEDAYVILSNAHHELNAAALATIMDWTFHPGKKGGKPARGEIVIPVRFSLGRVE